MVYCTKCGANNADDAKVCIQCGAPLYPVRAERETYRRRREDECFGIPHGGVVATLVFGVIIVIFGLGLILSELYQISIPWWSIIIIIVGILMIVGAIYRYRRI
jgi:uncharacterized membrane protein YvbJ